MKPRVPVCCGMRERELFFMQGEWYFSALQSHYNFTLKDLGIQPTHELCISKSKSVQFQICNQ